jgi:hypothetical protein
MQKHTWKYRLISAVAVLFIFGSCPAVLAADAALAKTVFYVQ